MFLNQFSPFHIETSHLICTANQVTAFTWNSTLGWNRLTCLNDLENVRSDLSFLLNNINNFQPWCSILVADFIAKLPKWCSTDKNNTARITLNRITSTADHKQMIHKPNNFTNGSSSCIDSIFSSNTSYLTTGSKQSVYDVTIIPYM